MSGNAGARSVVRHKWTRSCRRWALPSAFSLGGLAVVLLLAIVGRAEAGYQLFDDFEDETIGAIGGQDGWHSAGGDNRVEVDPADSGNQVLYVPSDSSTLYKSLADDGLGVVDDTVRMMFMRLRVGNKQTFSVGLAASSAPDQYGDFATEVGLSNSAANLDLHVWDDDGGNYENLTQLNADTWYNMWVLVDSVENNYQVWLNTTLGGGATAADKLSATDGDETFDFRSGDLRHLITFYMKTSGGSSGTNFGPVYVDDIYLETTAALNLGNPTIPEPSGLILLGLGAALWLTGRPRNRSAG